MATQKTQIAEQLERIEAAKETLLGTALTFGLTCYDPDEGEGAAHTITEDSNIAQLSWGFSQIPFYPSPKPGTIEGNGVGTYGDPNTAGIFVSGQDVYVADGYYNGLQRASVQTGLVETPTVSINPADGTITVTKKQTEGYIQSAELSYNVGTVTHENLVAENIKSGTTVFGIAGTFTADANATSNNIVSGNSAYVNGQKVEGSIPDYGDMGVRTFNPLEDDTWMLSLDLDKASIGAVVKGLQVGLSNDLLRRLQAI